ncbi:Hypp2173 [Branchiostoma lanceolatum]|uniref:Hypp2173 protein n=1 Tax=Branchiostoma lanceolatum TaxID=7740 RepID=A0A8J9ZPC9_BRALA|nr:Hypp2173 [Branchiostoma lanceolatum]
MHQAGSGSRGETPRGPPERGAASPRSKSGLDASVSAGGNCENLSFGGRSFYRSPCKAASFDKGPQPRAATAASSLRPRAR